MKPASKLPANAPERSTYVPFESGIVVTRDARKHPRRSLARAASIATLEALEDPEGARYFLVTQGETLNLGDGGLGLQVEAPLAEGARVLVDVDLGEGRTMACSARVAWTTSDASGALFVGLSFDTPRPGFAQTV